MNCDLGFWLRKPSLRKPQAWPMTRLSHGPHIEPTPAWDTLHFKVVITRATMYSH
jgi:hypothetical protein